MGNSVLGALPRFDWDDDLLTQVAGDGKARLRVAVPQTRLVVLGRSSKPEQEVNQDACTEEGVELFRRPGGGCSVLLDPGNVIVSTVVARPRLGDLRKLFDAFSLWMIEGLDGIGLPGVTRQGISDLTLGDRKLGGSALYLPKGLAYYSTTILVDPDLDLMERLLLHPPKEPSYRQGRSHRAFVTTLQEQGGFTQADDLARRLRKSLRPPIGVP